MHYWYSIWVKMQFSCFPVLPGSEHAQVIWGGIVKRLLITYYIGNISAKKYQSPFTCVKVIASQRWDVFETQCMQFCFNRLWDILVIHYLLKFLAKVNSCSRSLYAIARPSVCRLGGSNFRQYFYGIRYLGHPLTSTENFTEIIPGEPIRRGS